MTAPDLASWLLAQYDADEQVARATEAVTPWVVAEDGEVFAVYGDLNGPQRCSEHPSGVPNMCDDLLVAEGRDIADLHHDERARHVARWGPAAVLADLAAKRRIVDLHACSHECSNTDDNCHWVNYDLGEVCDTLRLLALPHARRDGYDPSWAPDAR